MQRFVCKGAKKKEKPNDLLGGDLMEANTATAVWAKVTTLCPIMQRAREREMRARERKREGDESEREKEREMSDKGR